MLGLLRGVHDLQAVDVFDHAVFHFASHRTAVADHVHFQGRAQGQRRTHGDDDQGQDGRVDQHARAHGALADLLRIEVVFHRMVGTVAYQSPRPVDLVHHGIASIDAGGAADAFILQAVADIDTGRTHLYAQGAIDAVAQLVVVAGLLAHGAAWFAALGIVGDDQGVLVEHGALEARVGAHVFAHLLAQPARVAVGCQAVEQDPEPFPGTEIEGGHLARQFLDRREVADKGKARPQGDGAPYQVLGRLLERLAHGGALLVEGHARAARALDAAFDPQEDFRVYRLRAREPAPHPPGDGRDEEQQIRTDDQQGRQIDEILGPQHDAENVELARGQIEQQGLPAIPGQPRQAVERQLGKPYAYPSPGSVASFGLARVDLLAGRIHLDDLRFHYIISRASGDSTGSRHTPTARVPWTRRGNR